jgi:hypothetical protein
MFHNYKYGNIIKASCILYKSFKAWPDTISKTVLKDPPVIKAILK